MSSENPFVYGKSVPPEHFVGRVLEIETAFDQILNRSHLATWGGSGVGKTSFLEYLASPKTWRLRGYEPSDVVIVLMNCFSIQPFGAERFWREILNLIKEELAASPDLQIEINNLLREDKVTKDSVRLALRKLKKINKSLLLLIDDYDVSLYPHDGYDEVEIASFQSEFRSLAVHSKEKGSLSIILTSFRRLNDFGPFGTDKVSPWYNHYLFQPLKPFDETETAELLGCMPMPLAIREGVRELAGGHPGLLQIAGFLLYRELRVGNIPSPGNFARSFESSTRHFFQNTWQWSSEKDQTLLMLIALSCLKGRLHKKQYDLHDINTLLSQRNRELTDLEERGIIIRTRKDGKPIFTFASSMMERWVIQEIGNGDEEFLQQRQKAFGCLMSKKQIEQAQTAIRWLWKHKDELPSTLEWIGKVATAIPKGVILG